MKKKAGKPASRRDIMKFLGCLEFYIWKNGTLHKDRHHFSDLIEDSTPWSWTEQNKNLSNQSSVG